MEKILDTLSIFLLAIGLAMDAFAVSISCSINIKSLKWRQIFKIGIFFGFFQAIMPLLGWLAGISFRNLIQNFDHWIAFGLLALIGSKMIVDSFKEDCDKKKINPLELRVLLGLSIATSIDALAAGVSFGILKFNILIVITIIGLITLILTVIGARIGKKLGCHFEDYVERIGGLILIGIGIKILIQHLIYNI